MITTDPSRSRYFDIPKHSNRRVDYNQWTLIWTKFAKFRQNATFCWVVPIGTRLGPDWDPIGTPSHCFLYDMTNIALLMPKYCWMYWYFASSTIDNQLLRRIWNKRVLNWYEINILLTFWLINFLELETITFEKPYQLLQNFGQFAKKCSINLNWFES